MAIVEDVYLAPVADPSDPDDYRPSSRLALLTDSDADMTVILEEIAPGDRIPLHTHTMDEVLFVDGDYAEVRLGEEARQVVAGAIVFIPAGTPHGTRNLSERSLPIRAVFPSSLITIEYLERNPAPGTEGDPPQRPLAINVRALVAGEPNAIQAL